MTFVLLLGQIVFGGPMLQATVCPERGGELCSLKVQHKGAWVETLYSSEDGWTGRAPWLWPATGKGDPLPAHGFVRDKEWTVLDRGEDFAAVGFFDSAATRVKYPYGFALRAEYRVAGKDLTIHFRVKAAEANQGPMPFAAGNHITFRTPLVAGTPPDGLTLVSPSTFEYLKLNSSPTGEKAARSLSNGVLLRNFDARTAVSLGGYLEDPVMELRDPGGLAVRISHSATTVPGEPVVRFNMWGDPSKGYFCPEPWVGLQNAHHLGKGLTRLEPGKEWDWMIKISLLN